MMLPVLDKIVQVTKQGDLPNLDRVLFVSLQHLLYTTLDIFQALIALGAKPNNMFLMGKHYSTCPHVVNKALSLGIQVCPLTPLLQLGIYKEVIVQDIHNMWKSVQDYLRNTIHDIETIVVLDDGGRCMQAIPDDLLKVFRVVGVEQTTAGIMHYENFKLPYVNVATSAAKSFEADMVAHAITNKIANKLPTPNKNMTCGVVGLGVIGRSVAKALFSLGYHVNLYDANDKINRLAVEQSILNIENSEESINIKSSTKVVMLKSKHKKSKGSIQWIDSLETQIESSKYIFGCTGTDCTQSIENITKHIKGNKYFVSCASEDKEFLSILKTIRCSTRKKWEPLGDIPWRINANDTLHILSGGFPCNFDHSGTSVPEKDIQLTRALNLGGVIQALVLLPSYRRHSIRGKIMLDPYMQQFILSAWGNVHVDNKQYLLSHTQKKSQDIHWLIKNSAGSYIKVPEFSALFNTQSNIHLSKEVATV